MKTIRQAFSIFALVLAVAGGSVLSSTMTMAQTSTWRVQNDRAEPVQLEFYSQNRKAMWPGNGKAYALYDRRTYRYVLDCYPGERICMGAWVAANTTRYWGVGPKNKYSCSACCFYCDGTVTPKQVLQ
jgi:hypothetical protein